jgi:ATP-dependent Lon protease
MKTRSFTKRFKGFKFNIISNDNDKYKRKKRSRSNKKQSLSLLDSTSCISDDNKGNTFHVINGEINNQKWKKGLSIDKIKQYTPIYNKIMKSITKTPSMLDVMILNIPFNEKCNLFEQIIILDNTEINTHDFVDLKKTISNKINKYKLYNISNSDVKKYKIIENSVGFDEYIDVPLKYQILSSDMCDTNKTLVYKKFKHLNILEQSNSEYAKLNAWILFAIKMPNVIRSLDVSKNDSNYKICNFLYKVKQKLDSEIYGLDSVKDQLLSILNNRILNPFSARSALAVVGPPGTAKTSIIQTLARSINLPFVQIALGGVKDSSYINGHSYTYEGSAPGIIASSISKLECKNGIIYFDEFDKIPNTKYGSDVSKTLLHITDFTQNHSFTDKYLSNQFTIDLSNIWFIYSLNNKSLLDKTLSDRMPILEIPGYNDKDKYEIAHKYLIPKSLKNSNLSNEDVIFDKDVIEYLIKLSDNKYTQDITDNNGLSGVRQLIHFIDEIMMKINILKTTLLNDGSNYANLNLSFNIPNFKFPLNVTIDIIKMLKLNIEEHDSTSWDNLPMYI